MTDQPITITSDEGLMAAIAHFFGILVALIVWATQKDKSRYVRFQAVQAMAFDLVVSVFTFIVVGFIMAIVFGILALGIGNIAILGSQANPAAEPFLPFIALMAAIPLLIPCIIIPFILLILVARIVATVETIQGKDFHYPWLGKQVERMLGR
jgi:uncharacterized Tic20 family protein